MAGNRPAVKWSELLRTSGLTDRWAGASDPIVQSVVEDSRQVTPGACFVAVRGTQTDGHEYISSAIQSGAAAVVCERSVELPSAVACLRVDQARGVAARLAASLLGISARQQEGRLKLIGVTGTNGKSTFCYLLRSILTAARHPAALIGTIEYDLVARKIPASMTTPPAVTLMGYLAEAADAGASHAVMEVSSHALDQGRCDGLRFDVGVFTNLTGDHLDYHGDMASYLKAKKRLFDGLPGDAVAVMNADDPNWPEMVRDTQAQIVLYGLREAIRGCGNHPAVAGTLVADIESFDSNGTRLRIAARRTKALKARFGEFEAELTTRLIGRYNVSNCLAAAAAAIATGIPVESVVEGLGGLLSVPGRLERVLPAGDVAAGDATRMLPAVFVDYAHTDDALRNVLDTLSEVKGAGRLIVLFGCGGDRDRTKRPRMARAAAEFADAIVVTSDNPRTEDPRQIIDDVLAGFDVEQLGNVNVVTDRRRAIADAISRARPDDIVLLAGKGHEDCQIIGTEKKPFDDRLVAAECLQTVTGASLAKGDRMA